MMNAVGGGSNPYYGSFANDASSLHPRALPARQSVSPGTKGSAGKKVSGSGPCERCQNRVYRDQSNDPGVSFKAGGTMNPTKAAALVPAHENEHVGREQDRTREAGGEVVSQQVRIFTDKCPECGKVYVSGGETVTVSSYPSKQGASLLDLKA